MEALLESGQVAPRGRKENGRIIKTILGKIGK
jgi:hypothetical protein